MIDFGVHDVNELLTNMSFIDNMTNIGTISFSLKIYIDDMNISRYILEFNESRIWGGIDIYS